MLKTSWYLDVLVHLRLFRPLCSVRVPHPAQCGHVSWACIGRPMRCSFLFPPTSTAGAVDSGTWFLQVVPPTTTYLGPAGVSTFTRESRDSSKALGGGPAPNVNSDFQTRKSPPHPCSGLRGLTPKPYIPNPEPETQNPIPHTLNPVPSKTLNPYGAYHPEPMARARVDDINPSLFQKKEYPINSRSLGIIPTV